VVRDGFREHGALGHLNFGAPRRRDLFGRLLEKRENMSLLCAVPLQKSIFCCANFGSAITLDQGWPTFGACAISGTLDA